MLAKQNPTSLKAWKKLEKMPREFDLKSLFAADPKRADDFSAEFNGMYVDYSKNLIDRPVLGALLELAD